MSRIGQALLRMTARGLDRGAGWLWCRTLKNKRADAASFDLRLGMTLREWFAYHTREIVFNRCRWMGVKALKNPMDLWIYQEILFRVKCDILIEIGSFEGGGTLFFANIFDLIGRGRVVSIDNDRSGFSVNHERIIEITGDSHSQKVLDRVAPLCEGKRVMVVHDGDHAGDAVLRDLQLYSGLVSKGSYLVVEDGIVDLFPPGDDYGNLQDGPLAAVQAFPAENPDFQPDPECERYLITYNPGGFLKRIR